MWYFCTKVDWNNEYITSNVGTDDLVLYNQGISSHSAENDRVH